MKELNDSKAPPVAAGPGERYFRPGDGIGPMWRFSNGMAHFRYADRPWISGDCTFEQLVSFGWHECDSSGTPLPAADATAVQSFLKGVCPHCGNQESHQPLASPEIRECNRCGGQWDVPPDQAPAAGGEDEDPDAYAVRITEGIMGDLRKNGTDLRSNAFSCICPWVMGLIMERERPTAPAAALEGETLSQSTHEAITRLATMLGESLESGWHIDDPRVTEIIDRAREQVPLKHAVLRELADLIGVCQRNHSAYRHASRFGLIRETPKPIVFHFETSTPARP